MGQKLGQHFLKNQAAVAAIIDALQLQPGETIIEIGPGTGVLTRPLLELCTQKKCSLVAIEKDAELARKLTTNNPELATGFELIFGDALEELPKLISRYTLQDTRYKIVGNIPYYITGLLLRVIGELSHKPTLTVLMIQKEVASRVCAQAPHMNLLAAAVQFWGNPKILMTLKETDFDPPPKVKSGVITITPKPFDAAAAAAYYDFIKIAFKQPRKLLLNNLKEGGVKPADALALITGAQLPAKTRAQDLSVEQLLSLSRRWAK